MVLIWLGNLEGQVSQIALSGLKVSSLGTSSLFERVARSQAWAAREKTHESEGRGKKRASLSRVVSRLALHTTRNGKLAHRLGLIAKRSYY